MAMTHYIQFMTSLAFGLLGLGMVLKVLMDNLFNDMDPVEAVKNSYRDWQNGKGLIRHERTEDALMAVENGRSRELTTRMMDRRREELNQLEEVEHRLHKPQPAAAPEGPLKVLLAVDAANASSPADDWAAN